MIFISRKIKVLILIAATLFVFTLPASLLAQSNAGLADNAPDLGGRYSRYINEASGQSRPFSSESFNVDKNLTTEGQQTVFTGAKSGSPILDFIIGLVEILVRFIGLATLIVVVVGAYYLLTAAGEEEQISKGKDIIKLGIIGMVIAIFSYVIISFVQSVIY